MYPITRISNALQPQTIASQVLPGSWVSTNNVALSFFEKLSNLSFENKLGLFFVVVLYVACTAIVLHVFINRP